MDIQKEREEFEAYMAEKYKNLMDRRQCLNNGGGYMALDMNVAWKVWQAAKAKSVPEGFVLVNKKELAKVLNCVTDNWLIDTGSVEEFKKIESLVQDEIDAMFGSQGE